MNSDLFPQAARKHLGAVGQLLYDARPLTLWERDTATLPRVFQELRLVRYETVIGNVMLSMPDQSGESALGSLIPIVFAKQERANRAQAARLLRRVGLETEERKRAGELSFGRQKLLSIACSLATQARILLLDEPTAGVHPDTASAIVAHFVKLRNEGRLVVLVEHDVRTVREVADRVIVMNRGCVIADGPPSNVLSKPSVIEAYLG